MDGKFTFVVDRDMVAFVQAYIDQVRNAVGDGELHVEQRLSIEHLTGEEGARGTSDVVIARAPELEVHDLKYGRGHQVEAAGNAQLRIYAHAALEEFSLLEDFETMRLFIRQPRLDHVSEEVLTVDELRDFGNVVKVAAEDVRQAAADWQTAEVDQKNWESLYLVPGEEQCRWCKAKAECPALEAEVADTIAAVDDFENLESPEPLAQMRLAYIAKNILPKLGMVEDWIKAVRQHAMSAAENGEEVPGYKLVAGRRGARAWTNAEAAENTLKSMRLKKDEMYDLKLISPTSAEKLLKDSNPKKWARLQDLIGQPDGKPSLVPESDKRPAVKLTAEDFDDISGGE